MTIWLLTAAAIAVGSYVGLPVWWAIVTAVAIGLFIVLSRYLAREREATDGGHWRGQFGMSLLIGLAMALASYALGWLARGGR